MANAGYHHDTKLIKKMITESKLIKITDQDHPALVKIKERFNAIVLSDEMYNQRHGGKKYVSHSAWRKVDAALLWVNQIRIKHRFFEPLAKDQLYKPKAS